MNKNILLGCCLLLGLIAGCSHAKPQKDVIAYVPVSSNAVEGYDETNYDYDKKVDEIAAQITPENEDEFITAGAKSVNRKIQLLYYDAVIKSNPENIRVWSNRAATKIALKDYSGAVEDASESIKLDPKRTVAYHNRALAYYYLGEYQEALDDLAMYFQGGTFITRFGKNTDVEAYILQANIFLHFEDYENALAAYVNAEQCMSREEKVEKNIYDIIGKMYIKQYEKTK